MPFNFDKPERRQLNYTHCECGALVRLSRLEDPAASEARAVAYRASCPNLKCQAVVTLTVTEPSQILAAQSVPNPSQILTAQSVPNPSH